MAQCKWIEDGDTSCDCADCAEQAKRKAVIAREVVRLPSVRVYDPMRERRSTRDMMTKQEQQDMIDAGRW